MPTKDLVPYQPLIKGGTYDTYYKVVEELTLYARKIESELLQRSNLKVTLKPGFTMRAGQQYLLTLTLTTTDHSDTLIKFYVRDAGYPVTVGYGGTEEVARDEEQLVELLYDKIPENESVQAKLRAFLALGRGYGVE